MNTLFATITIPIFVIGFVAGYSASQNTDYVTVKTQDDLRHNVLVLQRQMLDSDVGPTYGDHGIFMSASKDYWIRSFLPTDPNADSYGHGTADYDGSETFWHNLPNGTSTYQKYDGNGTLVKDIRVFYETDDEILSIFAMKCNARNCAGD